MTFNARYARNISEAQFPSLWRGLVGHWMPSMGIQASQMRDFSNKRNTGTVTGLTQSDWIGVRGRGRAGRGFPADGLAQRCEVLKQHGLTITADITLMCWVKHADVTTNFMAKVDQGNSNRAYTIQHVAGGTYRFFCDATGILATTSAVSTWNVWRHIAFTRAGSACKTYINGVVAGTSTNSTALTNNTENFKFGNVTSVFAWTGEIDDIRVYNRGLSNQEVKLSAAGWTPLSLRGRPLFGKSILTPPATVVPSLVLSQLSKTFKTAFTIAKATLNAAGLTVARTFTLPDQAGTVRLTLSTDDSVAAKLYASSNLR